MRRIVAVVVCLVAVALLAGAVAAEGKEKKGGKKGAAASADASEILAWVGGQPVTKVDLEARVADLSPQFRQQFATEEGKKQLLDRMVEEQVWTLAAEKAGVPGRPDIQRQIAVQRMNTIVRTYLGEVMQNMPAPDDSAVQAHYAAHLHDPQFQTPAARKVRHIQVPTEKEARSILLQLKKGGDFADLAKRLSKDGATQGTGGEIGRVERFGAFGNLGRQPALAESAYASALRVPVGPIQSSLGWHVMEVLDTIPAAPQPLENVRPQILAQLNRQGQEEYYKAQLEQAKESQGFRWNQAAVDSFLRGRKSAAELFREAQDALTADDRLAAYERVVSGYPQSEQAPQAQFMIGFVYSEEKNDYDRAEAAFKKLLADYPKSELRNSAQWMLDNMRGEAVPTFELPGGVKRVGPDEPAAPASPGPPGVTPKPEGGAPKPPGDKSR